MRSPFFLFAAPPAIFAAFYTLFFAAVLFGPNLLAYGDAIVQYVPEFYQPTELWSPDLFCGYPLAATPQAMSWYPLAGVLNELEIGWELFVVLGYVIASSSMCWFVHALTRSMTAGLLSGLVFGLSGFMILHLTHPTMVHTAAWVPAILLAIERLRERPQTRWYVAAAVFTALCGVSLHPQIFFYAMVVVGAYALVRGAGAGWRSLLRITTALVLGGALAAIQFVPSAELAVHSARPEIDYETFVSYSLPPLMAPILVFPFAFGASHGSVYADAIGPYLGPWNMTELSGYVGFLPLLLAALGVVWGRRSGLAWFWVAVAGYAFVLALGDTPLAQVAFRVPGYNLFRAPGRHLMEFGLAVAVLAGLGFAKLLEVSDASPRSAVRWVAGAGALTLVTAAAYTMVKPYRLVTLAPGLWDAPVWPWENPALGIPLALGLGGCITLLGCWRLDRRVRAALILSLVVAELVAFAWFLPWRLHAPSKGLLHPPDRFAHLAEELSTSGQRLVPLIGIRGIHGGWQDWMSPNLTMLWGVPCATGYKTLTPERLTPLLGLTGGGNVECDWQDARFRGFDVMAVRYALAPSQVLQAVTVPDEFFEHSGTRWSQQSLGVTLGGPQNSVRSTLLMTPRVVATRVHLVTALHDSVYLPGGTPVLGVVLEDREGGQHRHELQCGRDTAEWTLESPVHHGRAKHGHAEVFRSFPTEDGKGAAFQRHHYVATIALPHAMDLTSIRLQLMPKSAVGKTSIDVMHVSLSSRETSWPVTTVKSEWLSSERWRIADAGVDAVLLENQRAMPRTWLVPEVALVSAAAAEHAIRFSELPDGRPFDPARVALVESGEPLPLPRPHWQGEARLQQQSPTRVEISTHSNGPAFLVLADSDYPGWTCEIDGEPTDVVRTNYFARGVALSPGEHRVEFRFRPLSFVIGAGISIAALVGLLWISVRSGSGRRRRSEIERL